MVRPCSRGRDGRLGAAETDWKGGGRRSARPAAVAAAGLGRTLCRVMWSAAGQPEGEPPGTPRCRPAQGRRRARQARRDRHGPAVPSGAVVAAPLPRVRGRPEHPSWLGQAVPVGLVHRRSVPPLAGSRVRRGGRLSAGCAVPGSIGAGDGASAARPGARTRKNERLTVRSLGPGRGGAGRAPCIIADARARSRVAGRLWLDPLGSWTALLVRGAGLPVGPCLSSGIDGDAGSTFQGRNEIAGAVYRKTLSRRVPETRGNPQLAGAGFGVPAKD